MGSATWRLHCLGLLVSLQLCNGATYSRWGCHFKNKNYEMPIQDLFDVAYGEEVPPMVFKHKKELQYFLSVAKKEVGDVLVDYGYSDMQQFIDFYDAYKAAGDINDEASFKKLFENYSTPFRRYLICYASSMEIMTRIARRVPQSEPHFYLCTSNTNVTDSFLYRLSVLKEVPKYFIHHHAIGCMKITLRDKNGYIIFDGGFGIREAVLVWEKGSTKTRNNMNEEMTFSYMKNSLHRKYIVSKEPNETHVYFVELPMCSFLSSGTRNRLPSMFRRICQRDRNGYTFAAYYIALCPEKIVQGTQNSSKLKSTEEVSFNLPSWNPRFTLGLYNREAYEANKINVPFKLFPHKLTQVMQAGYNDFKKKIFIPMLEEIILKNKEIALDTKYLTFLYNMGKWISSERKKMSDADKEKYKFDFQNKGIVSKIFQQF